MSNIVIKIVCERDRELPGVGVVDFDEEQDAREWAVYAIRHQAWRMTCEAGETRTRATVQTAVAIASPDGRVAVWYGRAALMRESKNRSHPSQNTVTKYDAAHSTLRREPSGRAAARYWDTVSTRGGDRCVLSLASAGCRILHARAFGDPVPLRDELLAEFAVLGSERPPTPHILRASDNELLAASALLAAGHPDKVRALLGRKGVAA